MFVTIGALQVLKCLPPRPTTAPASLTAWLFTVSLFVVFVVWCEYRFITCIYFPFSHTGGIQFARLVPFYVAARRFVPAFFCTHGRACFVFEA